MLLSYRHNLALYNIKSLKDGRNEQCHKLFDSVVSNTAHKLAPDTILETSAILRRQKCTLIVTRTHLLHLCPIG